MLVKGICCSPSPVAIEPRTARRDAQRRPRRLEPRPLAEATGWLETYRRYWEGNFGRLDAVLEELKARKKHGRSRR
jgi:hypothetical protein